MPKKQVMIVDYGAGNVRSVGKAVEKLGYAAKLSDDPDDISVSYTHLTLPTTPYV